MSDILDDILDMLRALSTEQGSDYAVSFSSDEPGGLDVDWCLSWRHDELSIRADWRSAIGGLGPRTRGVSQVSVSRSAFVQGWLNVLDFLRESIGRVKLDDDCEVRKFQELLSLFQ